MSEQCEWPWIAVWIPIPGIMTRLGQMLAVPITRSCTGRPSMTPQNQPRCLRLLNPCIRLSSVPGACRVGSKRGSEELLRQHAAALLRSLWIGFCREGETLQNLAVVGVRLDRTFLRSVTITDGLALCGRCSFRLCEFRFRVFVWCDVSSTLNVSWICTRRGYQRSRPRRMTPCCEEPSLCSRLCTDSGDCTDCCRGCYLAALSDSPPIFLCLSSGIRIFSDLNYHITPPILLGRVRS